MDMEELFIIYLLVRSYHNNNIDKYSSLEFGYGNVFTNNSAVVSGGAIYWNYNQPKNIATQSYSNNFAKKYGNNYACFAQVLKTITESQYNASTSIR